VLGVVFRWDALGQQIMQVLPQSAAEGSVCRAAIIDGSGRVLADSDASRVGSTLAFGGLEALVREPRGARMAVMEGVPVRICHARSVGFETYATHWHCLVIRRVSSALALASSAAC